MEKTMLEKLKDIVEARKRKRAIGVQEARPTKHPGSKRRSDKKSKRASNKRARASRKANR